jgi:multimeric flavodoxin WrbA
VFNGSPRKERSNTKTILDYFLRGFIKNANNSFEIFYLMDEGKSDYYLEKIKEADLILIGFPLYVTAMPGTVKSFLEKMPKNTVAGKKICFFIQSGFPESYQVDYLEKYFAKLAKRLNYGYLGMMFKGLGASVEIMPMFFSRSFLRKFYQSGSYLGHNGYLNEKLTIEMKKPQKLSFFSIAFYKLFIKLGIVDSFTFQQLKRNGISVKQSLHQPLLLPEDWF